ncbi:hypothetical protein FKO59_19835 [Burkholderia pseudomallei]|nr:hypothetical protein BOC37_24935 [Burkholderia pseudomallei]ARL04019.1 hypothetical protein BOC44_09645 [Burkholderia pseudomallei]ARL17686.1 hypothetical protein BOC46_00225 [Burkholderia pseudomallei]ARL38725.1 hypothetical protein BOC49_16855 [Burkholderia pseudomallei]ARM02598.1 hypothetical protein BOC59_20465 [Burkholderia pseudomallei]
MSGTPDSHRAHSSTHTTKQCARARRRRDARAALFHGFSAAADAHVFYFSHIESASRPAQACSRCPCDIPRVVLFVQAA